MVQNDSPQSESAKLQTFCRARRGSCRSGPSWGCDVVRVRWSAMAETVEERNRLKAVLEVVESEKTYVKDLRTLIEVRTPRNAWTAGR